MTHLRAATRFILLNFGAPIAFFAVFHLLGARPAIAVAIAAALAQLGAHVVLRERLSPFFLAATTFTVLFGLLDFVVTEPRFFKLEPFAENAAMAAVFLATVLAGKPIVLWFARSLPERFRPDLSGEAPAYFRNLTLVWVLYFVLKGLLFLYLAYRVDLGQLILLRSIIGGPTLAAMVGGEFYYRTRIRRRRASA